MKKIIILLLCVCLLCGCSKEANAPAPTQEPTQIPTLAPTEEPNLEDVIQSDLDRARESTDAAKYDALLGAVQLAMVSKNITKEVAESIDAVVKICDTGVYFKDVPDVLAQNIVACLDDLDFYKTTEDYYINIKGYTITKGKAP